MDYALVVLWQRPPPSGSTARDPGKISKFKMDTRIVYMIQRIAACWFYEPDRYEAWTNLPMSGKRGLY